MPESRAHRETAERIAKKLSTDYNPAEGLDIKTPTEVGEIETPTTLQDAVKQLAPFAGKKKRWVAPTDNRSIPKLRGILEGTGIGIRDNKGNVVKRAAAPQKNQRKTPRKPSEQRILELSD